MNASTVSISPGTATVSYDATERAISVTPSGQQYGTLTTIVAGTGVKDVAGNALAQPFTLQYTTAIDPTPPSVVSTSPANGAQGVSRAGAISIVFSEPLDASTVNATNLVIDGHAATVGWDGTSRTATLTPTATLPNATPITARVKTGVLDEDGHPLAAEYVFTFTTVDTVPPQVVSSSPADGATKVAPSKVVEIVFDEPLDPATVTTSSALLDGIASSVAFNPTTRTLTLTPGTALPEKTLITARVKPTVTDVAGNALAAEHVFSFTTADVTAPAVTLTTPASGATGVSRTGAIQIEFTEELLASTVSSANVLLDGIAAQLSWSASTRTATLTPDSALPNATLITGRVKTGVTDLEGNALASEHVFSFTTADTVAPQVVSSAPLDGATRVPVSSLVQITFDEALDPATVTPSSALLDGIAATPSFSAVDKTLTLTPSAALPEKTLITARVKPTVTDLAGNALAAEQVFTFTTEDRTSPTVSSSTPADGATGVSPTTTVQFVFSEELAAGTVTSTNLVLDGIPAAVAWNASTRTATLTPQSALPQQTLVTARAKTGLTDLEGNALASEHVITFTTGDTVPPEVVSHVPADGASNVARSTTVTATFSEPMDPGTLTSASFGVVGRTGTVSYDAPSRTATWTGSVALASSTSYTAQVTTAAKDTSGNPLAAPVQWTFTTADTSPPTVVSTEPADWDHLVALGASVKVTFSEDVDPSTVNATNIVLGGVSATVSYDAGTRTATLVPSSPLLSGTKYVLTVANIQDVAGNVMAPAYSGSFRTPSPVVKLSGTTSAQRTSVVAASSPTGVLTLFTAANGGASRVHYGYYSGGTWTGGDLGAGHTGSTEIVYAAGKFLAGWYNGTTYSYRVFDGVSWTAPAGAPTTSGRLVASGTHAVHVDSQLNASVYDGTSFGAATKLGSGGVGALAANGSKILVVYYVWGGTGYYLSGRIFDGAAWSAEAALGNTSSSAASPAIHAAASASGFAVVGVVTGGAGTLAVHEGGTWTTSAAPSNVSNIAIASNGTGYALAWFASYTLRAQLYDSGAWGAATDVGTGWVTSLLDLESDGSGYMALVYSSANVLAGFHYGGGSWSGTTAATDFTPGSLNAAWSYLTVQAGSYGLAWPGTNQSHARLFRAGAWQPQQRIDSEGTSGWPKLAPLGGEYVSVLPEGPAYGRISAADGTFSAPVVIPDPEMNGPATNPQIAVAANGKALAAWEQTDRGRTGIFARAFDGTSWGAVMKVAAAGVNPRIATNGTSWVITYTNRPATETIQVYAARWTEAGGMAVPTQLLNSTSSDTTFLVSVAPIASSGGGFLIVWANRGWLTARYSATGTTWTIESPDTTSSWMRGPTVAATTSGYVIVYTDDYSSWTVSRHSRMKTRPAGSATWSSVTQFAPTGCGVLATDMVYGALCGGTAYLYGSGTGTVTVGTATPSATAGAEGGRFRFVRGATIHNTVGGAAGTSGSITGLLSPVAMASNRKSYFLLGGATDNGFNSIKAYRTQGTGFQEVGLLETEPGATSQPVMDGALGVLGAVWPQNDTAAVPAIWGTVF